MLEEATYSYERIKEVFEKERYVAEDSILIPVYLSLNMHKPLLIEGEPGCGKTEIAKVLAEGLGTELIRLQCYEGLDSSSAIYEWDYLRQLLKIRVEEGRKSPEEIETEIFTERFLLKRPLLKAVSYEGQHPPVLLIDEIDRADEEFEGFLLEFLAEFQVTIPEVGTIKAKKEPIVILTSNRTRDLGDGLKRRCIYLYINYPSEEKETKILMLKVPQIDNKRAADIVQFISKIRGVREISKKPGISETLDLARAVITLGKGEFSKEDFRNLAGLILKSPEDIGRISKII
jgi:MoxR-like ATPase